MITTRSAPVAPATPSSVRPSQPAVTRGPAPAPTYRPRPRGLKSPIVRMSIGFFICMALATALLLAILLETKGTSVRSHASPVDIGEIR